MDAEDSETLHTSNLSDHNHVETGLIWLNLEEENESD